MKKLLHIKCSPRKERSVSGQLAKKFLETYRLKHPHEPIAEIDLWKIALPEFDEFAAGAKYKAFHHDPLTPKEADRWEQIVQLFQQFSAAEKYVFSVPMWNFSIPYKLKQYIDLITQPHLAFDVTEAGYRGLVIGRPVVLLLARGGAYRNTPAAPMDMQEKYLELWLKFIGFTNIRKIYAEPMMSENRDAVMEDAMEAAITEAARF